MIGQRFGMLKVLTPDEEFNSTHPNKPKRVICHCDCGIEKSIIATELTRPNKSQKSCGCQAYQRALHFGQTTAKDLTGETFGELKVIEKIGTNKYNYSLWKCQCSCGKEVIVASRELLSGDTKSCGHLKSRGEKQIQKLLTNVNIQFKKEYTFADLKGQKGGKLRFDFALFAQNKLKCLIEFQGVQHYDKNNKYWNEGLAKHDQQKRDYCKEKSIPLYEIRYDETIPIKINEILQKEGFISGT